MRSRFLLASLGFLLLILSLGVYLVIKAGQPIHSPSLSEIPHQASSPSHSDKQNAASHHLTTPEESPPAVSGREHVVSREPSLEPNTKIGPRSILGLDLGIPELRTLDTRWLDPNGKAARLRVRIVECDFKYPLLRLTEKVSTDAEGKTTIEFLHAEVADHLIVTREPGVETLLADAGWKVRATDSARFLLTEVPEPENAGALPAAAERLRGLLPHHLVVENDPLHWICATVPNDPEYSSGKLWGLHNTGGRSGFLNDADIDAPEAWDRAKEAPNVVVAVIDTGVRSTHEDLAANMWRNPDEIAGNGIDDDNNGVVDDIHGFNAVASNGSPADDQGHGTHCAGTIGAAGNNGKGITGVAWKVQLMAVKFLTATGGGTTSDAIRSIDYARLNGAHIISASWGGGPSNTTLQKAIVDAGNAGIPFVAAAGNSGTNNDASPHYPSSYLASNILAVAASDSMEQLAGFSCYGKDSVDVAAPGVDILSTYHNSNSAYKSLSGTSMATPHVSGMLALAKAAYPQDDEIQLIARLLKTADRKAAYDQKVKTGARANLQALLGTATPPGDIETGGPENDMFAKPTVLTGETVAWDGTNRRATREADESRYNPAPGTRSIWFTWTAPISGPADAVVNADPEGMSLRVVVFEGATKSTLRVLSDSGLSAQHGGPARARFAATIGITYRVCITSFSSAGQTLALRLGLRPSNDNVAHAAEVSGDRFSDAASNVGATAEAHELVRPHLGKGVGKSIWWKWTSPFDGPMILTTDGSEFDTLLAVYQRREDGLPGDVVAENDDQGPLDGTSGLEFEAVSGKTYLIAIDSYRADEQGLARLNGFRPGPPRILAQPADLDVALGSRATFSVGAGGALQLLYQWFKDGSALPGQKSPTLVIDPVKPEDLGQYHVEVSNGRESVTSRSARLAEKLLPPVITWTSGDVAVPSGTSVEMRVLVSGSAPLSLQWSKDGTDIPGATSALLPLPSITTAASGTYTCRASNTLGTASATMMVTVVQSPFESWEYRTEAFRGPQINEIKVIGDRCYAVAGDRILISSDGENWQPWPLPSSFVGQSIEKLGNRWLCSGYNLLGSGRVAISTDGVTWSLHTPTGLFGTDGDTLFQPLRHPARLITFGGRFIGRDAIPGRHFGYLFTSTDGIAWTPSTLSGTTTQAGAENLVEANGMLISGNLATGQDQPARAFRSTDGLSWTEFTLPNPSSGWVPSRQGSRGACRWNNQIVLFSTATGAGGGGGWISPDGLEWTRMPGNSMLGGFEHHGTFISLDKGLGDEINITSGPDPWTATPRRINPTTGDSFTAWVSFAGRVVYGTKRGFLGTFTSPGDAMPWGTTASSLNQVVFLDGRFIATKSSAYGERFAITYTSGDGYNWKLEKPLGLGASHTLIGTTGGKFWGQDYSTNTLGPATGLAPQSLSPATTSSGLPAGFSSLIEVNGVTMAVANNQLYRSNDGGATWAQVTTAPAFSTGYFSITPQVIRHSGRWFITNAAPTYSSETGFVHHSLDGVTWTKTTCRALFLTAFGNKLYGLDPKVNTTGPWNGWQSVDGGLNWTQVTQHATNQLTAGHSLKFIGSFNNSLVVHLYGAGNIHSFWFSNDGASWFRANVPYDLVGITIGLGQSVGITSGGAVVQAGPRPPGGNAPVVKIDYPINLTSAVNGSLVEITGSARDPEGGSVAVECRIDGQLIGTAAGGEFRFPFRATSTSGHVIIVRAVDSAGLVGTDSIRITSTNPQMANLFDSGEGTRFLPNVAMVEFNGAFYAASSKTLYRSDDGLVWSPVLLPGLTTIIKGMAAGNGSLVIQVDNGMLYSTRDGVNWVSFGLPSTHVFWVRRPISFQNGRFLVNQQIAGQLGYDIRTSINGLDWTSVSPGGEVFQLTTSPDGTLVSVKQPGTLGAGTGAYWSIDGGNNWTEIAGTHSYNYGNTHFALIGTESQILLAAKDGRAWRSEDGRTWSTGTLPLTSGSGIFLHHAAGRFFLGNDTWLEFTSTDGENWTPISGMIRSEVVLHGLGRYLGRGENGMAWSDDGEVWSQATGGPTLSISTRLAVIPGKALVVDANGAAWSSPDGETWTMDFAPKNSIGSTSSQVGQHMTTLGGKILLGGTYGMLLSSADGGTNWEPGTLNGQSIPSNYYCHRLVAGPDAAVAIIRIQNYPNPTGHAVLRTTDGQTWTEVPSLAGLKPMDISTDGSGLWFLAGEAGALMRSPDGGQTWTPAPNAPSASNPSLIAWHANRWLFLGRPTASATPRIWTSEDGENWTDQGERNIPSHADLRKTISHGRLCIVAGGYSVWQSEDGLVWQQVTYYAQTNANPFVIPRPTGFLVISPGSGKYLEFTTTNQSFQNPTAIPPYLSDISSGASPDGSTLYLFSAGKITRWSDDDLTLQMGAFTPASNYGVGDLLTVPVSISNLGSSSVSPATLKARAWFSSDRFFGDGNDVYLGETDLPAATYAAGSSTPLDLEFRLPTSIEPGDQHIIVRLDSEASLDEKNTANNTAISREALVHIPQWQLNLTTSGSGEVVSTSARRFYAHKSSIGLFAKAGKGAAFSGWGGDAIGGLSEIALLMDGDKSVSATFVPQAAVRIIVRGHGSVNHPESGSAALGSTLTLEATPAPGWEFSGWSGALTGSAPSVELLVDGSKTVEAAFTQTFESWRALHFQGADATAPFSARDADADGDGISNWREFLHGSDARTAGSTGVLQAGRIGNEWVVLFTRNANPSAGRPVWLEASRDMLVWRESLVSLQLLSTFNGIETLEARLPMTGHPSGFTRFAYPEPVLAAPTLEDWLESQFTPEQLPLIGDAESDPDSDGLANWREYLHGSFPLDPSKRGFISVRRSGSKAIYTYTRLANLPAGYDIRPWYSTNLTSWSRIGMVESVILTSDGIETIEASVETSGSCFFRLDHIRP